MTLVNKNKIRADFSVAMSVMFRREVPAYGTLVKIVETGNADTLEANHALREQLGHSDGVVRVNDERHGAIRLGTAQELLTMRRVFAVMGMYPVGYYDLSEAGIPVHATAFRPITAAALAINPFRVFCSLLRLELIQDPALRQTVTDILNARQIFSDRALTLLVQAESDDGLNALDAQKFVTEIVETFRWRSEAQVDLDTFKKLLSAHRLIADVVSFRGPHINHLTPRTLDIDRAQSEMPIHGIEPKAIIEGPPRRDCPILLRQTSFKALTEAVSFKESDGSWTEAHHTARFGEIEQRGAALTPKGRTLYDTLLSKVRAKIVPDATGSNKAEYLSVLAQVFEEFPDDWDVMRRENLSYFQYVRTQTAPDEKLAYDEQNDASATLETAIEFGHVIAVPIVYEDFLPVSAAGIFQSNLGDEQSNDLTISSSQDVLAEALAVEIADPFVLYTHMQEQSILNVIDG